MLTAIEAQNKILEIHKYQREKIKPYANENFGFEGTYGCGLCQTNVPCE